MIKKYHETELAGTSVLVYFVSTVQQVSGTGAPVEGMGIVVVRLKASQMVIPLYPAYHMPNNPQHTLGLPAVKYYNEMRSVRMETLVWIRLVDQTGNKVIQETIKNEFTFCTILTIAHRLNTIQEYDR